MSLNKKSDNQHEQAVVFDFGGVLVDWNPHYLYLKFFPDAQAVERFMEEVRFREYIFEGDKGRPYAEIFAEMSQEFPQYEAPIRAYETRWPETIGGPIQPVVSILKSLKESGRTLYGLSNWAADNFILMRQQYEFFNWFDTIVISGEEGTAKPETRIFQVLLERTGRRAEDCLFIDDSRPNIEAAQKLGFQTIWYRDPEQLRSELRTRGLLNGDKE